MKGGYPSDNENVRESIAKGDMFFHNFGNSFIVTEVHVFPQYYNLHGFLAGGKTEEIKQIMPILERKAKSVGCKPPFNLEPAGSAIIIALGSFNPANVFKVAADML